MLYRKKRGVEAVWSNSGLFCLYFSFIISYQTSLAQIGIWQTHFSYQSGQSVALVGTKLYAATQNGFFYYDKTTSEVTTLGKTTGLSDVGISRLLYLADQQKLLIAYRNGNLDFLALSAGGKPTSVTNVNTIVSSSVLPVLRGTNHLNRIGNNVYISTDFGVIVLDLLKKEIRDTYFSQRPDGSPLPVYQTTATTDSLYALTAPLFSTDTGFALRVIHLAPNVNIADPANWQIVTSPGTPIESIATNQGHLTATVNGQGFYERNKGKWVLTQPLNNLIIRQFPSPNGLIVATDKAITLPGTVKFSGELLANPREAVGDGANVWVADTQNGLLFGNAGQFRQITPEGPTRDAYSSFYTYPNTLIALPNSSQNAGPLNFYQVPYDFFSVPAGRWMGSLVPGLPIGFNAAAYLPTQQQLYLSSFGKGLWSQSDGQIPTPVVLPTVISPFINSLATDSSGNLWIATDRSNAQQATLHVRQPNGTFKSFLAVSQTNIVQIVPDDNGFLWLRPDLGGGLIIFDPSTNRVRYLTTERGQGGLLTNSVRSLVKDRNGAIWVGTDLGPTVYDNPAGAFDAMIDAQPPLLNRRRLLANELITAITVDGGNRKWIGTRNGLYYVSPDGSQLLETFTAENSPLPANTVQALAIEPISGKVFIQTASSNQPYGLVSYQGPATEPTQLLTGLTIFPNPVRPDFSGMVGIQGLTQNATVKILDAGGQLVYETRSQGGTATWDLKDYRGRQVQTGIYLVIVITTDGVEGLAGKLAVVR